MADVIDKHSVHKAIAGRTDGKFHVLHRPHGRVAELRVYRASGDIRGVAVRFADRDGRPTAGLETAGSCRTDHTVHAVDVELFSPLSYIEVARNRSPDGLGALRLLVVRGASRSVHRPRSGTATRA